MKFLVSCNIKKIIIKICNSVFLGVVKKTANKRVYFLLVDFFLSVLPILEDN